VTLHSGRGMPDSERYSFNLYLINNEKACKGAATLI